MNKTVLETERKVLLEEIDLYAFAGKLTNRQAKSLKQKVLETDDLEKVVENLGSVLNKNQDMSENNAEADALANDIQTIGAMLLILEESENEVARVIEHLIKDLKYIKVTQYDLYKIGIGRTPYGPNSRKKYAHAVLTLKYNNTVLSIGFNASNEQISFSKNGRALRFFTLPSVYGSLNYELRMNGIEEFLTRQLI